MSTPPATSESAAAGGARKVNVLRPRSPRVGDRALEIGDHEVGLVEVRLHLGPRRLGAAADDAPADRLAEHHVADGHQVGRCPMGALSGAAEMPPPAAADGQRVRRRRRQRERPARVASAQRTAGTRRCTMLVMPFPLGAAGRGSVDDRLALLAHELLDVVEAAAGLAGRAARPSSRRTAGCPATHRWSRRRGG